MGFRGDNTTEAQTKVLDELQKSHSGIARMKAIANYIIVAKVRQLYCRIDHSLLFFVKQ